MKSTATIFLLLITSFITHAQIRNDLSIEKLKGKVKTVTEYEYNGRHDSLKGKMISRYNDSGYLAELTTYAPGGNVLSRSECKYDDTGRFIEEDRYKADGSLMVKTTRKYDARGNVEEENNFDAAGTMFLKVVPRYDFKGNRKVKDSYNEFGSLFLKANYKFDDKGNEIEMKEYDSHHGLKFTTSFAYGKYDNAGNWLEKTTYKDDDPVAIFDREIAYY